MAAQEAEKARDLERRLDEARKAADVLRAQVAEEVSKAWALSADREQAWKTAEASTADARKWERAVKGDLSPRGLVVFLVTFSLLFIF